MRGQQRNGGTNGRLLALIVAGTLLAGCQAPPPPPPPTDERPRCTAEARYLEAEGNREIGRANKAPTYHTRTLHHDLAIHGLHAARELYWRELAKLESEATYENPIPTGRREALEIEIDRLSVQLARLYVERPYDREPRPVLDPLGNPW
jgi:hypothetical protein